MPSSAFCRVSEVGRMYCETAMILLQQFQRRAPSTWDWDFLADGIEEKQSRIEIQDDLELVVAVEDVCCFRIDLFTCDQNAEIMPNVRLRW